MVLFTVSRNEIRIQGVSQAPLITHQGRREKKMEKRVKNLNVGLKHYQSRSAKNRNEKNNLKQLHHLAISKQRSRHVLQYAKLKEAYTMKEKKLQETAK